MTTMRRFFERFGGLRVPRASAGSGPRVVVFGPAKGSDMELVGTLWQENGEFVFRYDPAFVESPTAEPISAFPDLREEYRSRDLWPFFAVRIPPSERSDVQAALARRNLRADQTLEVLGTLAQRTISNPYQLKLAGAQ